MFDEVDKMPDTLKHIVEVGPLQSFVLRGCYNEYINERNSNENVDEKCITTFVNPFLEWRSTWEVS